MDTINKVYLVCKNNEILTYFNPYSLKDAIESGKYYFVNLFEEKYCRIPNNEHELFKFINHNYIDCTFMINVISGNRLRFKTSEELINYFMSNIDKVSNDKLYDFLLSFVDCHSMIYDYKGNCISNEIISQCPSDENVWDAHIEFTEESCKDGKFRFSHYIPKKGDIGIDTLYNASWIKRE